MLSFQEIFILVVPFVYLSVLEFVLSSNALILSYPNISLSIDFEPSESESEEEVPVAVVPKV